MMRVEKQVCLALTLWICWTASAHALSLFSPEFLSQHFYYYTPGDERSNEVRTGLNYTHWSGLFTKNLAGFTSSGYERQLSAGYGTQIGTIRSVWSYQQWETRSENDTKRTMRDEVSLQLNTSRWRGTYRLADEYQEFEAGPRLSIFGTNLDMSLRHRDSHDANAIATTLQEFRLVASRGPFKFTTKFTDDHRDIAQRVVGEWSPDRQTRLKLRYLAQNGFQQQEAIATRSLYRTEFAMRVTQVDALDATFVAQGLAVSKNWLGLSTRLGAESRSDSGWRVMLEFKTL
jgi:hypothetical protein